MAVAAADTVPPRSSNALLLRIAPLNHGSRLRATSVHGFGATMASMSETYWDRLRPAMEAKGIDIAGLARALGLSYQAVKKVSEGGAFGSKNNIAAASLLQVNPVWLATGRPASAAEDAHTGAPPLKNALPVTLRAIASAAPGVRAELAQALALFAQTGASAYSLRIMELLLSPAPSSNRLARVEIDAPPVNVNQRELENVLGGLIELAGAPSEEAREKGRQIARDLASPKPPAAAAPSGHRSKVAK